MKWIKNCFLFSVIFLQCFVFLSAQLPDGFGGVQGVVFSNDDPPPDIFDAISMRFIAVDGSEEIATETDDDSAHYDEELDLDELVEKGYDILVLNVNVPDTTHVYVQIGDNGLGTPVRVVLQRDKIITQNLPMRLTVSQLAGTVVDPVSDSPLSGVEIEVSSPSSNQNQLSAQQTNQVLARTRTDSDGRYFLRLPSGNFRVKASLKGFRSNVEEIDLAEDEQLILNFSLVPIVIPKNKFLLQTSKPIKLTLNTHAKRGSHLLTQKASLKIGQFGYRTH